MKILKKLLVFTLTLGLLGWLVSALPTSATYGQNLPPGQRASGFLYDGTDVILASGQLLLQRTAASAPAIADINDTDVGLRFAADQVSLVVGSNDKIAVTAQSVRFLSGGNTTLPAIWLASDSDTGPYQIGANNIGMTVGGALVMDWEDTNAAGAGADLVTISFETGIMDGSDTVRGLFIDPTSADHTGGALSNTLIGLDIDTIVGDSDTSESGLRIGSGWDSQTNFADDSMLFVHGVTANNWTAQWVSTGGVEWMNVYGENHATGGDVPSVQFAAALGPSNRLTILEIEPRALIAMDGSDTYKGLNIDLTNANHTGTGNTLIQFDIDAITGDAQATEIGLRIGAGNDLAAQFNGPIQKKAYRQDFDQLCDKREQVDYTIELVVDAAINLAACQGDINLFNYRLEGDQASPFIVSGGSLDMDNDGAENEGVEIVIADSTTSTQGWSVVGTSPAMFLRANITITSVSGTDNMYVGWRLQEAFQDNLAVASYDTYGTYLINSTGGNIVIQTDVNGGATGTDEDDQIVDWGDAETHTLEVRLATDGVFTFYIDDLPTTIANANDAAEAGDIMIPMIGLLNAAHADTELKVNWIEIGEVI